MPPEKMFTAERIIGKLHEAEVELTRKKPVPEVVRKPRFNEQTYDRWKREYGGQRMDQSKRLNDLEKENARLKRLLADAEPDKTIPRPSLGGQARHRPDGPLLADTRQAAAAS